MKKQNISNTKINKLVVFFSTNPKALVGVLLICIILFVSIAAPLFTPYDPTERLGPSHQSPSAEFKFGTTQLGRDVLSQTLYGGRISLSVGIIAGIIVMLLAMVIGISAGYFGGIVDHTISTAINVVMVIPNIPLLLVLASILGKISPIAIGVVIGLTSWAWGARVIRSQTMSIREREFVRAAETLGESPFRILFFEIMPNMMSMLSSLFVGTVIYAIMAEATLEFLGFGDPLSVTWGIMLYNAQNSAALRIGAWWEVIAPCIALVVLGSGLALLNFSIDEISNPRLKAQRVMINYYKRLKKEGKLS